MSKSFIDVLWALHDSIRPKTRNHSRKLCFFLLNDKKIQKYFVTLHPISLCVGRFFPFEQEKLYKK